MPPASYGCFGPALTKASTHLRVTFAPHDAGGQPWGRQLLGACTRRSLAEVLVRGDWSDDVYPVRPSAAPGVGVTAEQLGFRS